MSRTALDLALTRRQMLQLAAAGAVAAAVPGRRLFAQFGGAAAPPSQLFLTAAELAIVDAATARIIPTDANPGAHEAGVTDYIQGMLSMLPAVDANCDGRRGAADFTAIALQLGQAVMPTCPGADVNGDGAIDASDLQSAELALFEARAVFAGGPFSGREPFGDFSTGQVTATFPSPSFDTILPLSRIQQLAWKVRLDGASAVAEVANNPLAASLPYVNLRSQYRTGLAQLDSTSQSKFSKPFVQLTGPQQDQVLSAAPNLTFASLLSMHTIEGFLSDPVYGGNRDRVGWQVVGYDGDSQPLGYTLGFDDGTQQYIGRSDKPNSGPNPSETCGGFSATMFAFLSAITTLSSSISAEPSPTMIFPSPFCFGVST